MTFVRPEALSQIRIWAEPAIYAAVAILCGVRGISLLANGVWTGAVLTVIAVLAIFGFYGATTRAAYAFRNRRIGPGVVSIQEARIIYMGPTGGAIIARDALVSVDVISGNSKGSGLVWVLRDEAGGIASIPGTASGSMALIDVLGSLPGFDHASFTVATGADGAGTYPVWRRDAYVQRLDA